MTKKSCQIGVTGLHVHVTIPTHFPITTWVRCQLGHWYGRAQSWYGHAGLGGSCFISLPAGNSEWEQDCILGTKLPQQRFWVKASNKFRFQKLPGSSLRNVWEVFLSVVLGARGHCSPLTKAWGTWWNHRADFPSWSTWPLWCQWWTPDYWPTTNLHGDTPWLLLWWKNKMTWGMSGLKVGPCDQPASYQKGPAAFLGHWDDLALQLITLTRPLFSSQTRCLLAPYHCEMLLFSPCIFKNGSKKTEERKPTVWEILINFHASNAI